MIMYVHLPMFTYIGIYIIMYIYIYISLARISHRTGTNIHQNDPGTCQLKDVQGTPISQYSWKKNKQILRCSWSSAANIPVLVALRYPAPFQS